MTFLNKVLFYSPLNNRIRFGGRHGFDVISEYGTACRGPRALVNPLGKLVIANTEMAMAA